MRRVKKAIGHSLILHRALSAALAHDCLNLAQSAAYSAMVALFPALVVAGAVIAILPDTTPIRYEVGAFFDKVLPAYVFPLLTGYFARSPGGPHTARALILAGLVSLTGGSSVIATLMEGLRRAEDLPNNCWTFWQRRCRALLLVPLSLVPLVIATVLVIFGQFITTWLAGRLAVELQPAFYGIATAARWIVSLGGVVGLTALIFHMGTPKKQNWFRMLPSALVATALWFLTTLVFGWYVTRFANYSQVYGSLGAGIALLFWLYIVFLSLLIGAEFNAQFFLSYFIPQGARAVPADAPLKPSPPHDLPNAIG
jgi:membrane protein